MGTGRIYENSKNLLLRDQGNLREYLTKNKARNFLVSDPDKETNGNNIYLVFRNKKAHGNMSDSPMLSFFFLFLFSKETNFSRLLLIENANF